MAKTVTMIPASLEQFSSEPIVTAKKRKTAGYARVSTGSEEQETSYEAQMKYYKEYIENRDDLEFVGMYSDEGISATTTAHRAGFNAMIDDALNGKIELIITKSVSRFARNTVDSLTTIRKLKDKGIEVYFEKENIWTLDAKGELLITIMSSLAQEESRSISENTTWGQRKRFADGRASVAYKNFLGYDRGPNGGFVINQEQAETVRLIYKKFLSGMTCHGIAKMLTEMGIPTPGGKQKWAESTVRSILKNEKYKGDALLQKKFTVDFLSKKCKKNEGEVPQYYVEGDHEAIIPPRTFDLVQSEMARRAGQKERYSGSSIFSSKIKCGQCGGWYGAKVWHSTDKYRKVIYRCNSKFKNEEKCTTPHVTEKEIKDAFVKAVNSLISDKQEIITNLELVCETLSDTSGLEAQRAGLAEEITQLADKVKECVMENASVAQDQEAYKNRYNALAEQYSEKKAQYDTLGETIKTRKGKREALEGFVDDLRAQKGIITKFDENLWNGLVDYATVYGKDDIRMTFKDGTEI